MEYGQEHVLPINVPEVPGTAPYTSQTCLYFTSELYNASIGGKNTVVTLSLLDNRHISQLADRILIAQPGQMSGGPGTPATFATTTGDNLKARFAVKGSAIYTIRNQSTEPMQFTAYYCRPRGNINYNETVAQPNFYTWLSTGFANNGIDNGHQLANTNVAMNQAVYSPFNSFDFVRDFKISKVKNYKIQPGQMKKWRLKSKNKLIRPADIIQILGATTGTWGQQIVKYAVNKHERFILFKAWGQPGGWGAAQATYLKQIQMTQPGFVLHTKFKYTCYKVTNTFTPSALVENVGIADNSATSFASIIIPDAAVKGLVSVAI